MSVIKKLGFIAIATLFLALNGMAQDEDYTTSPQDPTSGEKNSRQKSSKFDWKKVSIGGGLGLQFGSTTFIDISPTFGYRFTEDFSAGFGVTYLYYSIPAQDYSSSVYGGGPFARYIIIEDLFAHVEYQVLNSETYVVDAQNRIVAQVRENVQYFWVGGGYIQPMGGNSYLMLMILYDINNSPFSIYPTNPIIRMGLSIGL